MPKKKISKKRVKAVVVPDGEDAPGVLPLEKIEKLDSFKEQFLAQVDANLKEMEATCEATCKAIDAVGARLLKRLGKDGDLTVEEYRKKIQKSSEQSSMEVTELNVSKILQEVEIARKKKVKPVQACDKRRVAGFATPAATSDSSVMWTATPKETPLFDKRLLNITTGKPSAWSFNGQPIDPATMDPNSKRLVASKFKEFLRQNE